MPQTPHVETHFTSSEKIRDIVIGMSDGLTVPFAVAAGLSGVVESTGIVITAGLAEVAAEAIAMGLGGYLAARTDAEHYLAGVGASLPVAVTKRIDFVVGYGYGINAPRGHSFGGQEFDAQFEVKW